MFSISDLLNSYIKTEIKRKGTDYLILITTVLLFWFCSNQTNNPSNTTESQSYTGRYKVNKEVIFAATSSNSFDMMMNCITTNDRVTLDQMISSGDLIYLRQSDVVLLYEAHMKYFIVRREGSSQLLYVISELLTKE